MYKVVAVLIWVILTPIIIIGLGYAIGATIEHFTEECPPYHQCTPSGDWNHPNCKCWERR